MFSQISLYILLRHGKNSAKIPSQISALILTTSDNPQNCNHAMKNNFLCKCAGKSISFILPMSDQATDSS